MIRPASFLLFVALAVGVRPSEAAPLTYTMTLTPDSVTCPIAAPPSFIEGPCPPGTTVDGIHPPPTVGQAYIGSFTLQDGSVLATDGKNLAAVLTAFRLQLGDQVWDAFHPYPATEFLGFRGPEPGSPGFDVAGGQLVGLSGGVFGLADVPWVDFFTDRFRATPAGLIEVTGTILLAQVSQPPALLLLSAGLGLASLISGMLRQRGRHLSA